MRLRGARAPRDLPGHDVERLYREEIGRLVDVDGLTELHNRRFFDEALARAIAREPTPGGPLAVLLVDVDDMRRINEDHGHMTGDFVIQEVARIVEERVPPDAVAARYQDATLAILLPGCSREDAVTLGETLRSAVSARTFEFQGDAIAVALRTGISLLEASETNAEDVVKRAEARLG